MRRGIEIASVVAAVALTAAFWLVDGDGARLLVMAVWIVVIVASGGTLLVASLLAARPPEQRPQRFVLVHQGFFAPPHPDLRRALGPLVLAASAFLAMMIDAHKLVPARRHRRVDRRRGAQHAAYDRHPDTTKNSLTEEGKFGSGHRSRLQLHLLADHG